MLSPHRLREYTLRLLLSRIGLLPLCSGDAGINWVALLPFATQPRIPQHWRPRYPHQGDLGELTVCGLQLHPISLAPIILDASYICRRSSIHSRSIVHLPHSVAYNALVPTYTPAALRHSRSLVGDIYHWHGAGSTLIANLQAISSSRWVYYPVLGIRRGTYKSET